MSGRHRVPGGLQRFPIAWILAAALLAPPLAAAPLAAGSRLPAAAARKAPLRFLPQAILVRLGDSVTVDAEAWFHAGKPFRTVTADRSGSLDHLLQRLDVRNIRAVFRAVAAGTAVGEREGEGELAHIYRLDLGDGIDPEAAVREIARDPHVVYAERDRLATTETVPNDTYADPDRRGTWRHSRPADGYADLWNLERIRWGAVWTRRQTLWPQASRLGGGGIAVAVLDSGVDVRHEDLAANIWHDAQGHPGYDFVDVDVASLAQFGLFPVAGEDYTKPDADPADHLGHGTHVAGTIAAVAGNGKGIAGIAWKSQVMAVRAGFAVQDAQGFLYGLLTSDAIASGIHYAASQGAKVINMSFGGYGLESQTEAAAIRFARSHGVLLVAAAGNDNTDTSQFFPAADPQVIAVAATLPNDRRVGFSNWGRPVALAAPGSDVLSLRAADTDLGGAIGRVGTAYMRLSGTSMATPHVAGALALILSAFPGIRADEATARLIATADPVPETIRRNEQLFFQGSGRLNLLRALQEPVHPAVSLRRLQVLSDDDGDGDAEPGEHVTLAIELRNDWRISRNVTLDLTASGATVSQGHWTSAAWQPGVSMTVVAEMDVPADLPWGETGDLRLVVRGNGLTQTIPLPLALHGPAPRTGWPIEGVKVGDGLITSPALGDLDGDGSLDVVYQSTLGTLFARHADGTPLLGWPVSLAGQHEQASPLIVDLDGDGRAEVLLVVAESLNVLDAQGQERPGWPQHVPALYFASVAVGDVTGDGKLDVVLLGEDGRLYVYSASGQLQPGWPVKIGSASNTTPVLVDLDADGSALEIVTGTSDGKLVALRGDGTPAAGHWPLLLGAFGPASPAVGDLDGNGQIELVVVTAIGTISRIDRHGTVVWQRRLPGLYSFSSPALGDLDEDGRLDIAVGSFTLADAGFVTALDADGNLLPGWPVETAGDPAASPALADLDGDGRLEVLIPDLAGILYAFRSDGHLVPGWPYDLDAYSLASPVVADLDGDGVLEVFAGRLELGLHLTSIKMIYALESGPAASRAPWPTFKRDARRTGAAPR